MAKAKQRLSTMQSHKKLKAADEELKSQQSQTEEEELQLEELMAEEDEKLLKLQRTATQCDCHTIRTYESLYWMQALHVGEVPLWSRLRKRNGDGDFRNKLHTKLKCFDVELKGCLYSLWGQVHPDDSVFDHMTRGRHYLACNVMACCAAFVYPLCNWNSAVLNAIILHGDRYQFESCSRINECDFGFSLAHYNKKCTFTVADLELTFEPVAWGEIFAKPRPTYLNLCSALVYFFSKHKLGILQLKKRYLAIGHCEPDGYFMFDCQSREFPLFKTNKGVPYLLRTVHLVTLLMCINETIKVDLKSVKFHLHAVHIEVLKVRQPELEQQAVDSESGKCQCKC